MVEELLKSNEGKTLEFKENLRLLQNLIKTIVAFANTAGGTIVIGVEDKTKKVIGITNPLAEEERLASAINDSIVPLIMPEIEIQTYRNKNLIIVTVPHEAGPCYVKAAGLERGTFIRLGSTNRVVDSETLQTLKNISRNIYFDELPYVQGKPSDLDWYVIEDLFKKVGKKITTQSAKSLGLLGEQGKKDVPSQGGIILFGKNRSKLFPEAKIRCARFLGNNREKILDQTDLETYLPLALDEAINFIQRNTRMGAEITGLQRKDIPEYPPNAVREALVNAIVHTNYAIKGNYITVAIFNDRIEFTNPGGLLFGLTLDRALAGVSRIRNRVIAKVFHHLKWIEQWGRGLQLIVDECIKAGMAEPKFEEIGNQFRVTLYSEKKREAVQDESAEKIVRQLRKRGKIGTKDAAALWKITPRAARLRLIKLVEAGILQKTGTSLRDPLGGYVLVHK